MFFPKKKQLPFTVSNVGWKIFNQWKFLGRSFLYAIFQQATFDDRGGQKISSHLVISLFAMDNAP